jgi:hypothetical protein
MKVSIVFSACETAGARKQSRSDVNKQDMMDDMTNFLYLGDIHQCFMDADVSKRLLFGQDAVPR